MRSYGAPGLEISQAPACIRRTLDPDQMIGAYDHRVTANSEE